MALFLTTPNAAGLMRSFNQAIANNVHQAPGPRVATWRHVVHEGSNYYTHTSANWKDKAFFRGEVEANRAAFYIGPAKGVTLKRDVYAYYAGHLAETFMRDFPTLFASAQATSNAVGDDSPF